MDISTIERTILEKCAKDAGWEDITAICIAGTQGDSTAQARLDGYQKGVEEAGNHEELMKKNGLYAGLYRLYS